MAKTSFEKAHADWPKMKILKNGGVHLRGVYEHPGLASRMLMGWVFLSILFALPTGGVGLVMAFFYPLIRPSLVNFLGKKLDVKILHDRIQLRSGWGYKNYSREMPIEFRVEQHQKAIDEELAESKTGRRKPRTYREAVETVMQYGEKRIAVAELPVKAIEQAKALAFRLQTVCNSLDAALEIAAQGRSAPAQGAAGDFGTSPQIR